MTPEQQERIKANRAKALQRLKKRGFINQPETNNDNNNNDKDTHIDKKQKSNSSGDKNSTFDSIVKEATQLKSNPSVNTEITNNNNSTTQNIEKTPDVNTTTETHKPIKPSIKTSDYIDYDFSTMKNLYGGYIDPSNSKTISIYGDDDNTKSKSLEDWKREQQKRKDLYELAPPPLNITDDMKCSDCKINIELDPILLDIFKIKICKSCVKNKPEKYSLLTKTECKNDYFLTESELMDDTIFHKLEKPNPHSGTFARMQLFLRLEIEDFAFKKWGSEDGLDLEWERRETLKIKRNEKKYKKLIANMRLKTRAQEYTKKLQEKKFGKKHIHDFSNNSYTTNKTDENGHKIVKRRCADCGLEIEEFII